MNRIVLRAGSRGLSSKEFDRPCPFHGQCRNWEELLPDALLDYRYAFGRAQRARFSAGPIPTPTGTSILGRWPHTRFSDESAVRIDRESRLDTRDSAMGPPGLEPGTNRFETAYRQATSGPVTAPTGTSPAINRYTTTASHDCRGE